jgi:hypothetical protein
LCIPNAGLRLVSTHKRICFLNRNSVFGTAAITVRRTGSIQTPPYSVQSWTSLFAGVEDRRGLKVATICRKAGSIHLHMIRREREQTHPVTSLGTARGAFLRPNQLWHDERGRDCHGICP